MIRKFYDTDYGGGYSSPQVSIKNPRFQNIHKVSDIVDTMVKGLKKEWVTVNMDTYGMSSGEICFGCAATNTLCELMQRPFTPGEVELETKRTKAINYGISMIDVHYFERAINSLRLADLGAFLDYLEMIEDTTGVVITPSVKSKVTSYIRNWHFFARLLPKLHTQNYKIDLKYYEKFRDWLVRRGL